MRGCSAGIGDALHRLDHLKGAVIVLAFQVQPGKKFVQPYITRFVECAPDDVDRFSPSPGISAEGGEA